MIKVCKYCGKTSEEIKFYNGSSVKCSRCHSKKTTEWAKNNPDKRRAIRLKYTNANKEKRYAYYKEWYAKNGRNRDKLKTTAHATVYIAIKNGRLIKPEKCSNCGRTDRIESHHDDYYKPIDVIWLCNRCHREKHTGY